ncbi:unnamed protein product [Ectocarpus sp. CCAP 1310/34]|nr:unnamed protein product [Ectocarpus sp. CCAP 1310/34]
MYVLLEACETFSDKIIGSGVTVAMDNFFTGAALLRCLATRDIFAVGTLTRQPHGVDLANYIWSKEGMKATERGQMLTARSDELVIVKKIDSQECTAALEAATQDGGVGDAGEAGEAGEGGAAADSCDLTVAELREFQSLKKAMKVERVDWDRRLANHLMSLCSVGHTETGARRATKAVETYSVKDAKSSLVCYGGICEKTAKASRYTGSRTRGVCWCDACTDGLGKDRALILCTMCHRVPAAHVTARKHAAERKYKPNSWSEVTAM